jgi:tryptophan-rich sensory protein
MGIGKNCKVKTYTSYKNLKKPSWAPPSWLFGPVWTFLYILIFISFGKVLLMSVGKEIVFAVGLPFILNLIFNFAFTPIQFGLKNNLLAAIDVLLILSTLIWSMIIIFPIAPWVAYLEIPYLIWVCIATTLQLTITYLNW